MNKLNKSIEALALDYSGIPCSYEGMFGMMFTLHLCK